MDQHVLKCLKITNDPKCQKKDISVSKWPKMSQIDHYVPKWSWCPKMAQNEPKEPKCL